MYVLINFTVVKWNTSSYSVWVRAILVRVYFRLPMANEVHLCRQVATLRLWWYSCFWILLNVLLYLEMIQQILCDCKRCTNHHLRHILWGKIQVHSLIQHWKNIKINQRCIKCVWGSVGTENTLDRPAHSGSSHGRSWWDSSFLCICSPPVNNNTVQ